MYAHSSSTDIVVVGAGAAGSVIARRLVDAGLNVTVIEAGPADVREEIASPFGAGALFGSEVDWGFSTVPQFCANGRVLYLPRGKTLGGSSVFNGMLYVRGAASDYDAWQHQGAEGWQWSSVEPYFRRLEEFEGGAAGGRGTGGPLHVQRNEDPDDLVKAFVAAAMEAGHPFNEDYNSGTSYGVSFTQHTVKHGKRVTSWRGYSRPIENSPLLQVITQAVATRIVMEAGRAAGVEYLANGEVGLVRANQEVVLTGGVFGTPQLLMLSGIGPAEHLRLHDIPVIADRPGVGQNLQDHVASPVVWESTVAPPTPRATGFEAHIFADSRHHGHLLPDTQSVLISFIFSTIKENLPEQGFTGLAVNLHPQSRGHLALRSSNPLDAPLIDPAVLSDPRDIEVIADNIEMLRDVANQPALRKWIKSEAHPSARMSTREQLRSYVRASVDAGQHQVGTARMGVDDLSVVNPSLLVHGVDGLRVADASIIPLLPSGDTIGATTVIAERAADFILGRDEVR